MDKTKPEKPGYWLDKSGGLYPAITSTQIKCVFRGIKRFLAVILLLGGLAMPVQAWEGKVVHVADGDSATLKDPDGKEVRVRFYGIDCPEYFQDYGQKARDFTVRRIMGRTVRFERIDTDKDGRLVGLVRIDGDSLNEELLENGLAWYYGWFCRKSFCPRWEGMEQRARKKRMGLWADTDPVPPWTYRKTHPRNTGKTTRKDQPRSKTGFSGNVSSKVFHRSSCTNFNCKNCSKHFKTSKEARDEGYRPCGRCKPE